MNEIFNFTNNLVNEIKEYFKNCDSLLTNDDQTCKCNKVCEETNQNNHNKCKNNSNMRKHNSTHREGDTNVLRDVQDNTDIIDNLKNEPGIHSSMLYKNTNDRYEIQYDYVNNNIFTIKDAVEVMHKNLNDWTFEMRCNIDKSPYLSAYYIFNNFTITASWNAKDDEINIILSTTKEDNKECLYYGYWDELSGVIKFNDIEGYPSIDVKHETCKKIKEKPEYQSPTTTSTVCETIYTTADVSQTDYKCTTDNWNSDTFTSNDTTDAESTPEKFTSSITAESLYNKITNDHKNQSLYDIHILKAVEKILAAGDYRISESQTMIWFDKDQIIKNIPNEIIGQFFAGKYDTFTKVVSNEHLSKIIVEGFEFPLVSVDANTVRCDLC